MSAIETVPDRAPTTLHRQELRLAVVRLERPTLAARLADYAGQPFNIVVKFLPAQINNRLRGAVRTAIFKCLETAVHSLDEPDGRGGFPPPSEWTDKVMSGLAGGIGGFFGLAGLPFELPLTTALMLRSIAEIARSEGEDLTSLEALLACVEVFALGGRSPSKRPEVDYYALRTVLARMSGQIAAEVMERGALNASSPIVARLVGEIVGRFGVVVTDQFAAGFAPLLGSVGGVAANVIFMDHFQRIARGHFTVRRLERLYGSASIRTLYRAQLRELNVRRGFGSVLSRTPLQ